MPVAAAACLLTASDGTAAVAVALGQPGGPAGRQPLVISGGGRPSGWTGKVWAMRQGLDAAGGTDDVLFADADISFGPGTVAALVRAAEGDDRGGEWKGRTIGG